jgi:hypothetical protein
MARPGDFRCRAPVVSPPDPTGGGTRQLFDQMSAGAGVRSHFFWMVRLNCRVTWCQSPSVSPVVKVNFPALVCLTARCCCRAGIRRGQPEAGAPGDHRPCAGRHAPGVGHSPGGRGCDPPRRRADRYRRRRRGPADPGPGRCRVPDQHDRPGPDGSAGSAGGHRRQRRRPGARPILRPPGFGGHLPQGGRPDRPVRGTRSIRGSRGGAGRPGRHRIRPGSGPVGRARRRLPPHPRHRERHRRRDRRRRDTRRHRTPARHRRPGPGSSRCGHRRPRRRGGR